MEKRWKNNVLNLLRSCKNFGVFVEELVSEYVSKARDPKLMESRLAGILEDIQSHVSDDWLKNKLKAMLAVLGK
ncbi:MAG: hypothetical protein QMD12_02330 [Candidatus Aenigmarchaeota archaeon]|nr:hypothetical protein [Candidatus Aenigmarchaeota archaeon]